MTKTHWIFVDGGWVQLSSVGKTLTIVASGLKKNWEPSSDWQNVRNLDITVGSELWQPNTQYAGDLSPIAAYGWQYIHTATRPQVKFIALTTSKVRSGSSEPDWTSPPDSHYLHPDNNALWQVIASGTDPGFTGPWQASHNYSSGGSYIAENGSIWVGYGGSITSGSVEPNWASAPNLFDTISDASMTWQRAGSYAGVWAANTDYRLVLDSLNYHGPFVSGLGTSTDLMQLIYSSDIFGESGSSAPAFDSIAQGSYDYIIDDGVLWQESTSYYYPWLVVTGFVAPTSRNRRVRIRQTNPISFALSFHDNHSALAMVTYPEGSTGATSTPENSIGDRHPIFPLNYNPSSTYDVIMTYKSQQWWGQEVPKI